MSNWTSNQMGGPPGPGQDWNQQGPGNNFIGPIPPENQETLDLTQEEDGKDKEHNGGKGGQNQGRNKNSDQGSRDGGKWNRYRDGRDNNRADRGDRNNRDREDRRDRNDRSRSNRGRERSSRFDSRDQEQRPLMPGMPGWGGTGGPGMGGLGGPDNNMMIPGMVPQFGNNMMPGQTMDLIPNMGNPNMMPGMNMMGNMMMPGQMHGQMPGHMHGQMPGQMPGQTALMQGHNMGQMPGMDQNMMIAQQMQMMGPQPIFLQAGVLLTPIPGQSIPPRRERPAGCRTIFVGGLPPGIGLDVIHEIFQRFGTIDDVKIHKQGVCHIRFSKQEMVEMSFFLSGFRFKLHEQNDNEATSLFIDYALNRDDQNESDKHKREPTPPRIEPFTSAALTALVDKIKSDTEFIESAPTLAGWLERGECNKKNANTFYSLIQACNNQVRRLYNEKMAVDEEYLTMKGTMKDKFSLIIQQFEHVAKILSAAKHKKTSDHFSKQQRRNIDMWLKMNEDLVNIKEEFNMLFDDDECEKIGQKLVPADKYEQLKIENDALNSEVEVYKLEAHQAQSAAERNFEKFKAQYIAQQALQGNRMPPQHVGIFPPLPPPPSMPGMEAPRPPLQPPPTPDEMKQKQLGSSNEPKLVAMLTAFLLAHPLGATLDYLASYVRSMMPGATHITVNSVLMKYGEIFARHGSDRWNFVLFDNVKGGIISNN